MKDIIDDLRWRGIIHQTTDDAQIAGWLLAKPRTLYAGIDPTAESLHVGSLLPLLTLRRFQKAGHRAIAVMGGATGMIGDPSGKSEERKLLSIDALAANVAGIERQIRHFLDFDDKINTPLVLNNLDWMRNFSFLDFLRDVGKNFPVNVMLAKDSVKTRLERADVGLSYTEFSYMLLQAYDFVHLFDQHGCELQVGGSDQWGNITAGIDLARRMRAAQLYGLTWPLLTKNDGTKMGKTEAGTIWLSAERTSPFRFYQYWFNIEDAEVGKCLRVMTELEREEIATLDAARATDPGKRESQKRLAESLTSLVHGEAGLAKARRATEILFGAEIDSLAERDLLEIFADVPSQEISREMLSGEGLPIVDALVSAGLSKSKGDARRLAQQGGVYVNNRRVEGTDARLTTAHLASESVVVLRAGKKNYALLRVQG